MMNDDVPQCDENTHEHDIRSLAVVHNAHHKHHCTKAEPAKTMMNRWIISTLLLVALCVSQSATAFQAASSTGRRSFTTTTTALFATTTTKPKFNKSTGKWEKAPGDDGAYPYDPIGSLLRQGPAPFLQRITNPDEYEQIVLQYMAEAGVSRSEATGNMDAKLNNVLDWSYQKREEQKGAPKVDYTVLKTKDAILTGVWAFAITPLVMKVIFDTVKQF